MTNWWAKTGQYNRGTKVICILISSFILKACIYHDYLMYYVQSRYVLSLLVHSTEIQNQALVNQNSFFLSLVQL